MSDEASDRERNGISRRDIIIRTLGAATGIAAFAPQLRAQAPAAAQAPQGPPPIPPPSTITTPPREFGPNAPPAAYPDPDIVTIDPAFNRLRQFNAPLLRLWTGAAFSEGAAWSSQGRYLVWSDIPNNRQLRWLEDDGRVTVFRLPSNNSNGNAFDFQGRQISCEHLTRRVVRYENDGSITIIADSFDGKPFNSPNDVVAHPDGSIWFTDPPGGESLYEGSTDAPGGPANQAGRLNPRLGQPAGIGVKKRELPPNVYRADPSGRIDMVVSDQQIPFPNGIAFSPDFKKLYVVNRGAVDSFDIGSDNKLSNQKPLLNMMVDGVRCGTDGIRVDVDGNLWCASNVGARVGYSGVTVWTPDGKVIGRIRLPEGCANLAFGGPKRNRLFMTAGQSLYAVWVATQGASPG